MDMFDRVVAFFALIGLFNLNLITFSFIARFILKSNSKARTNKKQTTNTTFIPS
jgi:hypothetical protein